MHTRNHFLKHRDFDRICRSLRYIDTHWREQPSLADMAQAAGLSSGWFDRLFHHWAGITPKSYLQLVTGSVAKVGLRARVPLLDTALAVGLSGPGRLHDLIVKLDAMSPAEYASQADGMHIRCGVAASPFGWLLSGETSRGICHLSFVTSPDRESALETLRAQWPLAQHVWEPRATAALAAQLWMSQPGENIAPLRLLVRGSQFQLKIWQALLALPPGEYTHYAQLGVASGAPRAARAVGGAVAANPIAWLIPCHRVLRSGGELGGYHWGVDRKRAMLAWESLHSARRA